MLHIKQGDIKYQFWIFGMTHTRIEPRSSRPYSVCVCVYIYIYIYTHIHIYICVCVCVCVCVYIYIYIYIYMYVMPDANKVLSFVSFFVPSVMEETYSICVSGLGSKYPFHPTFLPRIRVFYCTYRNLNILEKKIQN